jgi:hypothetical protein
MPKPLRQQRRGKGSNVYTKLPNTFDISVGYPLPKSGTEIIGEVVEMINHTGHTAPLMKVIYEDMTSGLSTCTRRDKDRRQDTHIRKANILFGQRQQAWRHPRRNACL